MAIQGNRRSLRLKSYTYSWPGAYFVTVCTHHRRCLFGVLCDGTMRLNDLGQLIQRVWLETGKRRSRVTLDEYVIMPNHLHGILFIQGGLNGNSVSSPPGQGRAVGSPLRRPSLQAGSLGAILAQFKSQATKNARAKGLWGNQPLWQRNYYEHIIRDEEDLNRIREYILSNPRRWSEDQDNPDVFLKRTP